MQHSTTGQTIEGFLNALKERKIAVIIDDCVSPSQGVLMMAAESATPGIVNELISLSRGILHIAITSHRGQRFQLAEMTRNSTDARFKPRYSALKAYVSVEARVGVTTGISAADRATTLRALGSPQPDPKELVTPGHIFPVEGRTGGVLVRNTLPDAALDCARLIGATDAAAYCHCLDASGKLLDQPALHALATKHKLPITTISEIVQYRLSSEPLVTRIAQASLPTYHAGVVQAYSFRSRIYKGEHLALVKGEIHADQPVLTRVQAEATYSDVFGGPDSTSRRHLISSMELIGKRGHGVIVYLRKSSHGCLTEELNGLGSPSPTNFDDPYATAKLDQSATGMMRQYGIGAQILRDLGISQVELISSRPGTPKGLFDFGLNIVRIHPLSAE
jgi:3,4-dihydroxy 2-butanone 4-phosphate synthase/GTP cyclohydrolase II